MLIFEVGLDDDCNSNNAYYNQLDRLTAFAVFFFAHELVIPC